MFFERTLLMSRAFVQERTHQNTQKPVKGGVAIETVARKKGGMSIVFGKTEEVVREVA